MSIPPVPTQQSSSVAVDPEVIIARMKIDTKFRNSMNWFYWIAGLSFINSILAAFGANLSFTVGLGITQLVDALAIIITNDLGITNHLLIIFSLVISLLFSGLFVLFGFLANKRKKGAIITGMVLYALDGILCFVIGIYIDGLFHLLALWGLFTGLRLLANGEVTIKEEKVVESPFKGNYYDNPR